MIVRIARVKPERVTWAWHHRVPDAKITTVDGDPGLGKSTLLLDLAARRSRGRPMPGEDATRDPCGVVVLSAEDGIADTIRPRLEAAGADLDRVAVMTAARDEKGRPRLPSLPGDLMAMRWAVRELQAGLLIVDPLMAFLSARVDSHRDQDVRGVLAQLAELAEDTRAAVLIVRHLNKTQGGHPIYRGGGSIGIIGAARAGLLVAKDPQDDSRRILAVSKSNLGPIPPALAYRLVPVGETSAVSWEGSTQHQASELLAEARADDETRSAREEAEAFLRELLAAGPVLSESVQAEARAAGLSWRTCRRAKDAIGVRATKQGGRFGGDPRWYWELPASEGGPDRLKTSSTQGRTSSESLDAFSASEPHVPPPAGDREGGQ